MNILNSYNSGFLLLDRDGVINEDSDEYIKSPDEWHFIDGSDSAIKLAKDNGYKVAVVTNQSGVGRGLFSERTLSLIHDKMSKELSIIGACIDALAYCPHVPDDNCSCRKPKIGLIEQVCQSLSVSTSGHILVGDSIRDIQAALKVDCYPILVLSGKGNRYTQEYRSIMLEYEKEPIIFDNLLLCVEFLVKNHKI